MTRLLRIVLVLTVILSLSAGGIVFSEWLAGASSLGPWVRFFLLTLLISLGSLYVGQLVIEQGRR